ncbi:Hypp5622 [Branchiostoma lanceolatum]|uniref:Hypp5622 protein n=1 Tax=Branchiostoma lanceolatum TaxID=7740 RepID=A0A8J9VQU1_BRALA|nr:Hypp5622 [Branchiostoma lanceolatum]
MVKVDLQHQPIAYHGKSHTSGAKNRCTGNFWQQAREEVQNQTHLKKEQPDVPKKDERDGLRSEVYRIPLGEPPDCRRTHVWQCSSPPAGPEASDRHDHLQLNALTDMTISSTQNQFIITPITKGDQAIGIDSLMTVC